MEDGMDFGRVILSHLQDCQCCSDCWEDAGRLQRLNQGGLSPTDHEAQRDWGVHDSDASKAGRALTSDFCINLCELSFYFPQEFKNKTKECLNKNGDLACTCWTEIMSMVDKVKACQSKTL